MCPQAPFVEKNDTQLKKFTFFIQTAAAIDLPDVIREVLRRIPSPSPLSSPAQALLFPSTARMRPPPGLPASEGR